MTVDDAVEFFAAQAGLARRQRVLQDVGLGYLRLGQPATTLSGGEAQRLKIAAELGARAASDMLYIMDEPTTGLHLDDVKKLLGVLNRLVDAGNTILVVEHHLDVIKSADYVIDLGPEGGDEGGETVAEGTPEAVAQTPRSYTGMSLVTQLWQPYLLYGLVAALGMSTAYVPCNTTVVKWFVARRGLAVGLASSGAGVGTVVLPPVAQLLVTTVGWRTAYVIFGVGIFVLLNLVAQVMRRDPESLGLHPDGASRPLAVAVGAQAGAGAMAPVIRASAFLL